MSSRSKKLVRLGQDMYEAKIILLPEQSVGEAPTENEDSVDDGPIENGDSRNKKKF